VTDDAAARRLDRQPLPPNTSPARAGRGGLRDVDVPLLASIPEPERTHVLEACETCQFERGEILFRQGDPGDALYVIETGRLAARVTTETGDSVTLDVLGPGRVVGELSLVRPGSMRTATVVAMERSTTRKLAPEIFRDVVAQHPQVATAAAAVLADVVERLTGQLIEALSVNVDRRVARRIWSLAAMHGGPVAGTSIPMTQQDLADLAGAARPTVNQTLKKLEAQGAVSLYRGGLRIVDPEALRRRAAVPEQRPSSADAPAV
jgi:CRP-like cAMP-binding protein